MLTYHSKDPQLDPALPERDQRPTSTTRATCWSESHLYTLARSSGAARAMDVMLLGSTQNSRCSMQILFLVIERSWRLGLRLLGRART